MENWLSRRGKYSWPLSFSKMIIPPTTLTTSGHSSHHFGPSDSINNDIENLQTVISDLRMRQNSIFGCCGGIWDKADSWIIRGPKLLPPSIRRNKNQSNILHSKESNALSRECNSQTPAAHFKYRTFPPKAIPMVSSIMGRLNCHTINNCGVEVYLLINSIWL